MMVGVALYLKDPARPRRRGVPVRFGADKGLVRVRQGLADVGPGGGQIASEAAETAIQELEASLPSASPPGEDSPLSLDAAMAYIRRHTPPA